MSITSILNDAVSQSDEGTWDFQCPGIEGSRCGDAMGGGRPFSSVGWPTKKTATERGREHLLEHAAHEDIERLKAEVVMAEMNVVGYEDVDPKDKQAELDALLDEARTSTLEDFRAKHGLGVNSEGFAVKLGDL